MAYEGQVGNLKEEEQTGLQNYLRINMNGNDHTKYAFNTQCRRLEISRSKHKQITHTKKEDIKNEKVKKRNLQQKLIKVPDKNGKDRY